MVPAGHKEKTTMNMDWVTCKVTLGGDVTNIVYRSKFSPVSVPELDILRALHGEASVHEVTYLKTTQSSPAEEKARLMSIYKEADVTAIYPGRNPSGMPMLADDRPETDDENDEDPTAPPKKKRMKAVDRLAAKGQTAAKVPEIVVPDDPPAE
jgi:hypothetical protein